MNTVERKRMTKLKEKQTNGTDASLHFYHKNTLKYLLKLDIIRFQKQPNNSMCVIEPTPSFRRLLANAQKQTNNGIVPFERVFKDLATTKGITLRKNLLYDMIKLASLDFPQISLEYYHKRTIEYLQELGVICYAEQPDGVWLTAEHTPHYQRLMEDAEAGCVSKMAALDNIFKDLIRKKEIKINKKARYDMIKLMSFIEKFGNEGKIWIKKEPL
jgi:hypothetical protein